MSVLFRRRIPIAMMLIVSIILFGDFFLQVPESYKTLSTELQSWAIIVAAFAMGLGCMNLLKVHVTYVNKREPEQWPYSVVLLGSMAVFLVLGFGVGITAPLFTTIYRNSLQTLSMTLYSLIGWLVIYALYRSFRAQSAESLYLITIFFFALMGNMPIGSRIWSGFPEIKVWIESIPNAAAVRGFYIAQALSAISMGLRTLAGKTRMGME